MDFSKESVRKSAAGRHTPFILAHPPQKMNRESKNNRKRKKSISKTLQSILENRVDMTMILLTSHPQKWLHRFRNRFKKKNWKVHYLVFSLFADGL